MTGEDAWRCWDCRSLLDPQWKRCPYCPGVPMAIEPIELPSKDEAVMAKLQEIADQYPASTFTPEGLTSDGIAGTAIRERMLAEIRMMREAGA